MQCPNMYSPNAYKYQSCIQEVSFHYRPVPECQRPPLKATIPRLWPKACAFCPDSHHPEPAQMHGCWHEHVPFIAHTSRWIRAILRCNMNPDILASLRALLCATRCKRCSNLAPDPTVPCLHTSPFYVVLWTAVQSQKSWAETPLKFLAGQNHQVIPVWGFNENSCTGDLTSDLGRGRPCSLSERLGELHLCILFLQLLPPTQAGAPNHCPGW